MRMMRRTNTGDGKRPAIVAASALAFALLVSSMLVEGTTQDFYTAASRRLHEEGVTRIKVCVDERGTLVGEPVVTLSSGYPRLDEASIKLAKAGSGRYKPATRNGKPVADCTEFNVAWKLR
jgi:TonB family protein